MTLPVSIYEALLVQVRELTHETILLQQQLSSDLFNDNINNTDDNHNSTQRTQKNYENKRELFSDNQNGMTDIALPSNDTTYFTFHQRSPQLETVPESFDAEELAARLITWRNHNHQLCQTTVTELKSRDEVVAVHHTKQSCTRLPDKLDVIEPIPTPLSLPPLPPQLPSPLSLTSSNEQRVGVLDDGVSETSSSSSSSVSKRRLAKRESNAAPHLRSFAGDPPLANELDHPPNGRETSTYKNTTTTVIPQRCNTSIASISTASERFNTNGREFLRLYRGISKNVMEPVQDSQQKTIGYNSENFARVSKCYDEDASSEEDIKVNSSTCTEAQRLSPLYHGTWPAVKRDTWTAQSIGISGQQSSTTNSHNEMASVMSYSSSSGCSTSTSGHRLLGAKVDVVYNLLGMLRNSERCDDMSATLLAMSNSIDSCLIMRQSGCLPLLVQLIHAPGQDGEIRERASRALHNVIIARGDDKIGRREARVLRLLEQLRDYCQLLQRSLENLRRIDDFERHPSTTIAALMKLSFDEAHRHAMCQLGGLHAIAELIYMDHSAHGSNSDDQCCITLRRYAGMALTNLTFGDGNNKALLCSFRDFMKSLVSQLSSLSDDLRQVTASVLRNLSWRADSSSKQTLREVGAVIGLMKAAMEGKKELTLKSILSALWNLSAHCSTNKIDICAVDGALAFLVDMLSYKAPSKTLSIVENAGGILRNISSHIAVREDYRAIVRERGCLQVLLRQLRSPSLTVVSNACGALWNLSAHCPHDQRLLWDLGAVPMLRSLVHSKHKMISMGSSAALKNLLNARPSGSNLVHLDSTARGLGLSTLPSLAARRQRALEHEIDPNLSETCENIEPSTSPATKDEKFSFKIEGNLSDINSRSRTIHHSPHGSQSTTLTRQKTVPRSESRESMRSVTSTHSDTIFECINRHVSNLAPCEIQMKQQSLSLHSTMGFNNGQSGSDVLGGKACQLDKKKYAMRYKNSIVDHATTSTMSWATGPDQESTCSIVRSPIDDKLLSPTESIKSIKSPTAGYIGKSLVSPTLSHTSETNLFGDYAETDLDEPTNYSLRYAERNSDEDEKQTTGYFPTGEQDAEDTIKTYYTEDTPRETSLNSSRATSNSDLQDEKIKQLSKRLTLPPTSLEIHSDSQEIDDEIKSTNNIDNNIVKSDINCLIIDDKSNIEEVRLKERESKAIRKQNGGTESESFTESMATSDCDEDDEDLLAACIHMGMQNNRHRQSFRRNSLEKGTRGESNLTRYQTSIALDQVDSNNTNELTSQESNKNIELNIKMNHNELTSHFEDNLNVAGDEKITVEYQKINSHGGHIETLHSIEENDCVNNESTSTTTVTATATENDMTIKNLDVSCEPTETPIETMSTESMDSYDSVERSEHVLLELCIKSGKSNTENIPIDETNMKENNDIDKTTSLNKLNSDNNRDEKNNINENNVSKSQADEYRRQRDPAAMIESLDRLTATLVQQTEAMRERELSIMKQSIHSDTWNEDSPNESFPTITMSVPLVGSFKSEIPDDLCQHNNKKQSDDTNNEQLSLTTSCIIEREAFKLADAVNAEFQSSSLSFNDDNIDAIKPPSVMNSLLSLTTSYVTPETNINSLSIDGNSFTSLMISSSKNSRKKSLPIGVVAKRAVCHTIQQQQQTGSLESLLFNDTSIGNISQLDNVKPPSMMDDIILDSGDMENSMISVSSITSEIADSKEINSIFDIKNNSNTTCIKYPEANVNNSLSDYLENINPPSLINEIGDVDDTTIDANTDTMCSDTLCIDNELSTDIYPHGIFYNDEYGNIEDVDVDDDDDDAETQVITECTSGLSSSAESTPKKLNRHHLTPKQKRQLAKERYKTYTIAAEMVKKEEEERRKNIIAENPRPNVRIKYSSLQKLTPKQRRQEDRARFQTQIVENPFGIVSEKSNEKKIITTPAIKSAIPSLKNFGNLRSEQTENRVKPHLTRTLIDTLVKDSYDDDPNSMGDASLQTMLEQNANIVLHTLNETGNKIDDSILDCETISLVSNDCDAEMSLRMRIANGSPKKFLTFTKKTSVSPQCAPQTQQKEIKTPEQMTSELNEEKIEVNNEIVVDTSESGNEMNERTKAAEELPKRPRIIKPSMSRDVSGDSNNGTDKIENQNSPKAIRGKRKALYSNPNTRKVTPQCSPIKNPNNTSSGIPIGRSNTSPIVRATRATKLRQNTNGCAIKNDISPKINTTTTNTNTNTNTNTSVATTRPTTANKNSTVSKRSSIPQRGSTSVPIAKTVKRHSTPPVCTIPSSAKDKVEPLKPLERQGTFTKDEPEVENTPAVVIELPIKSKIAKSTRNSPSKNYSINSKSKINVRTSQISQQSRLTKCASAEGITTPRITSTVNNINKRYSVAENGKVNDNAQANKKIISIGQRSNSNSSIISHNSAGGSGKKIAKETTSKIASLWKKVEENRIKQRFEKPDTRQWIIATPETPSPTVAAAAAAVTSTNIDSTAKPKNFRLFRSSTFEGVPKQTEIVTETTFNRPSMTKKNQSDFKSNYSATYRNSCDLTGMNVTEAPCKIPMRLNDTNNGNKSKTTNINCGTIVLRKERSIDSTDSDPTKRISRLGSFIRVESENQDDTSHHYSTIVPSYSCLTHEQFQNIMTQSASKSTDDYKDCLTASSQVTMV